MVWDKTKAQLEAGEWVPAWFAPEGVETETPGLLRWDPEEGVEIRLIGTTQGWSPEFSKLHGIFVTTDRGDEMTVPDALVRQVALGEHVKRLSSGGLLLGAHVATGARFSRALYATAHTNEWRGNPGLTVSRANHSTGEPLRLEYRPPTVEEFDLPGARTAFVSRIDSPGVRHSPSWRIDTQQVLRVDVRRRRRIDELAERFADPLTAFTAFAADRPDRLTVEVLIDERSSSRVEVWRRGDPIKPREWNPTRGFIFRAGDLKEDARPLRAWWRLYKRVWPALDLHANHVNQGNSYSPARLITAHSALEGYSRARHGHKDFKRLRQWAGVDPAIIGCSNEALDILGLSRKYFVHLGHTGQKYTLEDVETNAVRSTRVAAALLQACVLRDLGFSKADRNALLARHYGNWPVV